MDFTTHWYKKISKFFLVLAFCATNFIYAVGIRAVEYSGYRDANGHAIVSILFDIDLPDTLKTALSNGLSLNFMLDYDLTNMGGYTAYLNDLKRLVNMNKNINYKLSYHPILNKYQLSMDGYVTNYHSLALALRSLGQLLNFNISEALGYDGIPTNKNIQAKIKLVMSTKDVLKSSQIDGLVSKGWKLDSSWILIDIKGSQL